MNELSPTRMDRWRTWSGWAAIALVVAALGFGSGAAIGLDPAHTTGVVAGALATSFGLTQWKATRRQRHPNPFEIIAIFMIAGVVVLGLIQFIPYGRAHSNPEPTGEPAWSSPRTRELMVAACYGCHSNQVEWPWYSDIAPISWAVTDHVEQGRADVNYSEFSTDPGEADETIEVIRGGSMPPAYYTRFGLHPEAVLSDAEVVELIAGLRATPGLSEDDTGDDDRADTSDHEDDDDRD